MTTTEQLAAYLKEIAAHDGFIEVTLDCKRGTSFPTDKSGLTKCHQFILQWDDLLGGEPGSKGVHVGAAARWRKPTGNNGRAIEADVRTTPHLWVDIDLPDAQGLLDDFAVPPTMIIASGRPGHRQAYWRLDEPAEMGEAKAAMALLAKQLRGDSVGNFDRIMRPPGTHNRKPDANDAAVELVHHDDRRVSVAELVAACDTPVAIPESAARLERIHAAQNWDLSKDSLAIEEVDRLDRITGDTPTRDKTKIREHAKRKLVHARTALTNASVTGRPYGAQQLLGVARDLGRHLGGGLPYSDALRMLQDFEQDMKPEDNEQRKNNQRAIRRGLAQGADRPWRPGRDGPVEVQVSQDAAGGLRTSRNKTMVATMGEEGPGEALFMDGAIKVVGVVGTDEPGVNEAYEVLLTIGENEYEQYLEIADLANPQRFSAWCLARGLSVFFVQNAVPTGLNGAQRINRFLLSQGASASIVVPNLGWHPSSQAYLTVEGRITHAGFSSGHDGVRPHPHLRKNGLTSHRYGATKTVDEARETLREILTWQHPRTVALMGSWWVTTFLKNHIRLQAGDGLYPFLGLEGNSGTGKTSGMLKSLMEISGAPGKPQAGNTTLAALRSMLGAHNAGAVWLDDSDHVEDDRFWELIRGTTGDATFSKKGDDRSTNVTERLTAAVVVSGEGLNVRGQKANEERCVLLTPEDPTDRMDPRDPSRPQWESIQEFRAENPDLNEYAAAMVQLALQQADQVKRLPMLTGGLPGRRGEKAAILRLGAIVLERMLQVDPGTYGGLVDTWIQGHVEPETVNAFEGIFLRELLVVQPPVGLTSGPDGAGRAGPPIMIDREGEYYVSISRGMQWCKDKRIEIPKRLFSANALADQARAAGCVKVPKRLDKPSNVSVWRLPKSMLIRLELIEGAPEASQPSAEGGPAQGRLGV